MAIYHFIDEKEDLPFRYVTPTRWTSQVPPPYDTTMRPESYLAFAQDDLQEPSPRGLVNAFGNAKRALHFTIDLLLHQYGMFLHHRKSAFPTKLQLLHEIGLLPIALMRNLNVDRNVLEHEYALPPRARVEEAVDAARLILLAMEKLTERVPNEMVVGWRDPKIHSVLRIDPMLGQFTLHKLRAPGQYRRHHGVSYFTGPLRTMRGHLAKGVKIADVPWRVIPLQAKSKCEWMPIVSRSVRMQRGEAMHSTRVDGSEWTVTMGVTLPVPDVGTSVWNEMIEEAMQEGAQEKSETSDRAKGRRRKSL